MELGKAVDAHNGGVAAQNGALKDQQTSSPDLHHFDEEQDPVRIRTKWKAVSGSALKWRGNLVRKHVGETLRCAWPGKHKWRHLVWEKELIQPNYLRDICLLFCLLFILQSGCSTDYTHTHSFISSWRLIITGSVFSYTAQKQDWKIRGTQWRHMGTGTPIFHATKARRAQLTHNCIHCAHF